MRKTIHQHRVKAHFFHQPGNVVALVRRRDNAVHDRCLADDVGNSITWVERRIGVLKNHLRFELHGALLIGRHVKHQLAAPALVSCRWLIQPHGDAPQRGLATARLTDQPDHFALIYREVHTIDGMHDFFAQVGAERFSHTTRNIELFLEALRNALQLEQHTHRAPLLDAHRINVLQTLVLVGISRQKCLKMPTNTRVSIFNEMLMLAAWESGNAPRGPPALRWAA